MDCCADIISVGMTPYEGKWNVWIERPTSEEIYLYNEKYDGKEDEDDRRSFEGMFTTVHFSLENKSLSKALDDLYSDLEVSSFEEDEFGQMVPVYKD